MLGEGFKNELSDYDRSGLLEGFSIDLLLYTIPENLGADYILVNQILCPLWVPWAFQICFSSFSTGSR